MQIGFLSGEHPTFPQAELQALCATHGDKATQLSPQLWTFKHPNTVSNMAGMHAHGTLVSAARSLAPLLFQMQWTPKGSFAVRGERIGGEKNHSLTEVIRAIGAHVAAQGHAVDLENPAEELHVWVQGGQLTVASNVVQKNRTQFETRRVTSREHFSPVTLHPRRAAGLINLARIPPGGSVYDPFCGTGGILLESALMGYETWGSDLDSTMVQGSYQTLADTAEEPLQASLFVADIGDAPGMIGQVDGIIADLPYGKSSTTDNEALESLYRRSFEAFAKILRAGQFAVIGSPGYDLLAPVSEYGFELIEHHEEFAHKSLTRHYIVVKRAG